MTADPSPVPPCPSPFADRVLIVLGVPRSGTTWLAQLLLAHPDVAGVPEGESRLFADLADVWTNHRRRDGHGLSAYLDEAELAAGVRRFCDRLFAACRDARRPAGTWFVEKTPAHLWHLPEIRLVYPDAWFLHVIRDGRDVASSMLEFEHGTGDLAEAARSWTDGVRIGRREASHLARYREIRYEALVEDPVGELTAVFGWSGLRVDDVVREAVDREARLRVSRHGTTGPVGSGKWRQRLDEGQQDLVYGEAGDLLVELGYIDAAALRGRRRARRARQR